MCFRVSAQATDEQVVCEGHVGILSTLLELLFYLQGHPYGCDCEVSTFSPSPTAATRGATGRHRGLLLFTVTQFLRIPVLLFLPPAGAARFDDETFIGEGTDVLAHRVDAQLCRRANRFVAGPALVGTPVCATVSALRNSGSSS